MTYPSPSNQPPQPPDSEIPELDGTDMYLVMYMLLARTGGHFSVKEKVFAEAKASGMEAIQIRRSYDTVNKVWHFLIPRKRKQEKKLIVPEQKPIVV